MPVNVDSVHGIPTQVRSDGWPVSITPKFRGYALAVAHKSLRSKICLNKVPNASGALIPGVPIKRGR